MPAAQALRNFIGPLALIHAEAGPRLLRLARLGILGLWLVKLLLDPLWRLAEFPHALFIPTGALALFPGSFIDHLFTGTGLTAFWILAFLSVAAAMTNRFFPATSVLAAIMLTLYSSLIRSFGPAVHTDIVLLLSVYALALFSWADWAARKTGKGTPASAPLVTIVALLCLSYSLVGVNRLLLGGPRVFTGSTMEVWTIDASLRGYYFNTNVGWHVPQWPAVVLFLRLGLPVITCFEVTAPLCLVSSHYRWVFIPTMLSFHLLSLVFMNIFFFDEMFLYLLLVDWSRRWPFFAAAENEKRRGLNG